MNNKQDYVLLLIAIDSGEFDKLLTGEGRYFFQAKSDWEEPQNIEALFDCVMFPYWKETKDPRLPKLFVTSLLSLLNTYKDKRKAIYIVHSWLWYYFFCLNQKNASKNDYYNDLFEIDLSEVAKILKIQLLINKKDLMSDNRWCGDSGNSNHGLWDPLVRIAKGIRDTLGGPDFVPDADGSPTKYLGSE